VTASTEKTLTDWNTQKRKRQTYGSNRLTTCHWKCLWRNEHC